MEITQGVLSEILYRASRERVTYLFGDSIASLAQADSAAYPDPDGRYRSITVDR